MKHQAHVEAIRVFPLVLWNAKTINVASAGLLLALDLKIDQGTATVIAALFALMASVWQSYMLSKVHTLVNSNFSEAKAARVAAEASLKTSTDLNVHLQQQLDAKTVQVQPTTVTLPTPTGGTDA